MKCQKCGSKRLADVCAKCSDCCFFRVGDQEKNDYVPSEIGISDGTGDYVDFTYCLDCGQIQGKFPIDQHAVRQAFEKE